MMTPKQKRFCQEYLCDLNATQAAIRAGYSKKTAESQGSRLLKNVNVQAKISRGQTERAEAAKISAKWVLDNLIEVVERCMQKRPVMKFDRTEREMVQAVDPDTGQGVWEFDAAGANRALELIGKHIGMFIERSEIKSTEVIHYITDEPGKSPDAGMG